MRNQAPTMLPMFRSKDQLRIVAEILFSVPASGAEIARHLDLAQPTVARELGRLADAGVIRFETVGRSKLAVPTDAPFMEGLRQVIGYASGPPAIIRTVYDGVEGIDEIFIHGSWVDRFNGKPGPVPGDIDVVVVSESHDRVTLAEQRQKIEQLTGMAVDQFVLQPDHKRLPDLRRDSISVLPTQQDESRVR